MDYQKLVDEAFIASENAYAPYSSFKVGASLLLTDGTIIHGTNIEMLHMDLQCVLKEMLFFKLIVKDIASQTLKRWQLLEIVHH